MGTSPHFTQLRPNAREPLRPWILDAVGLNNYDGVLGFLIIFIA